MRKSIAEHFFEKLKNQELTESDHLQLKEWFKIGSETEIEDILEKYRWYFQGKPDEQYVEDDHLANLIENKLNKAKR